MNLIDRPMYYRMDGTPYEGENAHLEWAKDFEKKDRILKQDHLKNGYFVSTVWLGLDHGFGFGKPLIFETMVFPGNEMRRYSTKQEALRGHQEMMGEWEKAVDKGSEER